jgi:DnaJ-class molecular chaperone
MNTSQELLNMVATEAVEQHQSTEAVASSAVVMESRDWFDDYDLDPDDTCPECGGSGTDRYNDHILDCPKCGGEGTL